MRLAPTSAFKRRAKKLTDEEKALLRRALQRFRENLFDPRLRTHTLSGSLEGTWSFSVAPNLGVMCTIDDDVAYLLAVGSHDEVH